MKQYLFALYTQIHVNVIGLPVYLCLNTLVEERITGVTISHQNKKVFKRKIKVIEVFNELI